MKDRSDLVKYCIKQQARGEIKGALDSCLFSEILEWADYLKQENAQLKEALRKCSPYESYEYTPADKCVFCEKTKGHCIAHTDDCEYIQLTKESEGKG